MYFKTENDIIINGFNTDDLLRESKDVYLLCNIEEVKLIQALRQRILLKKNFNITFD